MRRSPEQEKLYNEWAKNESGIRMTTRKRTMRRPVDGLVGKFVWVVDDEKYGWQGIFSSKRKAEKALPRLHIGGFGCIVQKVKVQ